MFRLASPCRIEKVRAPFKPVRAFFPFQFLQRIS